MKRKKFNDKKKKKEFIMKERYKLKEGIKAKKK